MKTITLIIFLFCICTAGLGQHSKEGTVVSRTEYNKLAVAGEYHRPNRGGGFTMILKQNGKYFQTMQDCTWGFKTSGEWVISNDTVYLNVQKTYNHHGKKARLDTTSINYYSYVNWRKFLIKHDSLFIVFSDKLKYPMVKQASK